VSFAVRSLRMGVHRGMRPPFLRHTPVVLGAMADLGYHVIGASVDTKDYENDVSGLSFS
jgi:peptidoglycan/xylan/chitin deacetylase (PgdA/CDA1 family)